MPVSPYLGETGYSSRPPYTRSNTSTTYDALRYGSPATDASSIAGKYKYNTPDSSTITGRSRYFTPEENAVSTPSRYVSRGLGGTKLTTDSITPSVEHGKSGLDKPSAYQGRYNLSDNAPGSKGVSNDSSKLMKSTSASNFLSGNTASLLKTFHGHDSERPKDLPLNTGGSPTRTKLSDLGIQVSKPGKYGDYKPSPIEQKFGGKSGGISMYTNQYLARVNNTREARPREIDTRDINTKDKPKTAIGYKSGAWEDDEGVSRNRQVVRITIKKEKPEDPFVVKDKTLKTIAQRLIEKYVITDKKPDPYEYVPRTRKKFIDNSSSNTEDKPSVMTPKTASASSSDSRKDSSVSKTKAPEAPNKVEDIPSSVPVTLTNTSSSATAGATAVPVPPVSGEEENVSMRIQRATTKAAKKKELGSSDEVKDAIIAAVLHPDVDIESDEEMMELVNNREDGSELQLNDDKDKNEEQPGTEDKGEGGILVGQLKRFVQQQISTKTPKKKKSSRKKSKRSSKKSKEGRKSEKKKIDDNLNKDENKELDVSTSKSVSKKSSKGNADSILSAELILGGFQSKKSSNEDKKKIGKETQEGNANDGTTINKNYIEGSSNVVLQEDRNEKRKSKNKENLLSADLVLRHVTGEQEKETITDTSSKTPDQKAEQYKESKNEESSKVKKDEKNPTIEKFDSKIPRIKKKVKKAVAEEAVVLEVPQSRVSPEGSPSTVALETQSATEEKVPDTGKTSPSGDSNGVNCRSSVNTTGVEDKVKVTSDLKQKSQDSSATEELNLQKEKDEFFFTNKKVPTHTSTPAEEDKTKNTSISSKSSATPVNRKSSALKKDAFATRKELSGENNEKQLAEENVPSEVSDKMKGKISDISLATENGIAENKVTLLEAKCFEETEEREGKGICSVSRVCEQKEKLDVKQENKEKIEAKQGEDRAVMKKVSLPKITLSKNDQEKKSEVTNTGIKLLKPSRIPKKNTEDKSQQEEPKTVLGSSKIETGKQNKCEEKKITDDKTQENNEESKVIDESSALQLKEDSSSITGDVTTPLEPPSPDVLQGKKALKRPRQIAPPPPTEKQTGNEYLNARKILKRPVKKNVTPAVPEAKEEQTNTAETPGKKIWKRPIAQLVPPNQGDQFLQMRQGLKKPAKPKEDEKQDKIDPHKLPEMKIRKFVKKPTAAAAQQQQEGGKEEGESRGRPHRKQKTASRSASSSSEEGSADRANKTEHSKRPMKPKTQGAKKTPSPPPASPSASSKSKDPSDECAKDPKVSSCKGTTGSVGQDPKLSACQSADSGYGSSPSTPAPTPTVVDVKDEDTCTMCGTNCHKKCEKQMPNLCGVNQKLLAEALSSVKKAGSGDGTTRTLASPTKGSSSVSGSETETTEDETDTDTDTDLWGLPEIRAPLASRPKFKKYSLDDFHFIKVLGKGSYGKVMLAQQKDTENYFAVKCLKKDVVLEDNDVECTLIERKVLSLGTKHPYLCHLFCTFQTPSHLFFVMEYLTGGDLMFHIQHCGRFDEFRACFYAAEITSGLKFLHSKGIIYRDLKLDNILLDYQGHIRIADFGMCKLQVYLDRYADTFCGTPDYMAPEVIKGQHYNQCVDWWSFGVLLYEMLTGKSPFKGCDEDHLFWLICNDEPFYPKFLSREATEILKQLLDKDSSRRLGIPFSQYGEIKAHAFFKYIDWNKIERKEVETPYKPRLRHILDVQYFDPLFTKRHAAITPLDESILSTMDQTAFRDFSYTNPNITD